jgi:hypothetical protein
MDFQNNIFCDKRKSSPSWNLALFSLPFTLQKDPDYEKKKIKIKVNFPWVDDEVHFVLDQHAKLDFFYSASSLKQQSVEKWTRGLFGRSKYLILYYHVFILDFEK